MNKIHNIWLFLSRIWVYCYLRFHGYKIWSNVYRFIWERKYKNFNLRTYKDLNALGSYLSANSKKWLADSWKQLFDAVSYPGRVQDYFDGKLKLTEGNDCLPSETLLLKSGYEFTKISDIKVGDIIMGDGKWVKVSSTKNKGTQEILEFKLSNGGLLRCTPDHKLFIIPKINGYSGNRQNAIEIKASEIKIDDDLLSIQNIPAGTEFISIKDKNAARWMAECGRTAINKHVPSLNFDRKSIDSLIEGLSADADIRNGVFGTISSRLALQLRILLRMQGRSAHLTKVEKHGGLGKNPIYRITPRLKTNSTRPQVRVRSITKGAPTETYDIEVEGHRFYLPETDIIVHNCDEFAIYTASVLEKALANGPMPLLHLKDPKFMTVTWMEGWKSTGHNVCLIKVFTPGDNNPDNFQYAYMDYGMPTGFAESPQEVAMNIILRYSKKESKLIVFAISNTDLTPVLVGKGRDYFAG